MTESESKRIPDLDCREAKGTTTMLFSFEEWDAKDSIIQRRAQRPRRDVDLDKFSQVLRGSASDDFIAETSYFALNFLQPKFLLYIYFYYYYYYHVANVRLNILI